jgi:hypothetical protein
MTNLILKSLKTPFDKPIRLWDALDCAIVRAQSPMMARRLSDREMESKVIQYHLKQVTRETATFSNTRGKPHCNIKDGYPDNTDTPEDWKLSGDYYD